MSPDTFEEIITPKSNKGKQLILFLLARQIICGAGKVGSECEGMPCDYQISQRADFIKKIWSLDTVVDRAIINTRDWAYADRDKFRRLHVILGDANMCEHSMFLKYLLTSMFLKMSEHDFISKLGTNTVFNVFVSDPVSALRLISRDYQLEKKIILKNNEKISAIEILEEFLKITWKYFSEKQSPSKEEEQGLKELEFVLNKLQQNPRKLAGYLDWPTKLVILEKLQEKNGYNWSNAELFFHDWTYHNISEKGTYNKLLKRGKMKRLVSQGEIERAILEPPNTRAFIRGKCLQKFQTEVQASNWEFLRFVEGNQKFLLNLPDPSMKGAEYQDAIEKSHSIKDLVKNLKSQKCELVWTKI
jgi:proteasome accessory factor A